MFLHSDFPFFRFFPIILWFCLHLFLFMFFSLIFDHFFVLYLWVFFRFYPMSFCFCLHRLLFMFFLTSPIMFSFCFYGFFRFFLISFWFCLHRLLFMFFLSFTILFDHVFVLFLWFFLCFFWLFFVFPSPFTLFVFSIIADPLRSFFSFF